jgi:hypothetical protein
VADRFCNRVIEDVLELYKLAQVWQVRGVGEAVEDVKAGDYMFFAGVKVELQEMINKKNAEFVYNVS